MRAITGAVLGASMAAAAYVLFCWTFELYWVWLALTIGIGAGVGARWLGDRPTYAGIAAASAGSAAAIAELLLISLSSTEPESAMTRFLLVILAATGTGMLVGGGHDPISLLLGQPSTPGGPSLTDAQGNLACQACGSLQTEPKRNVMGDRVAGKMVCNACDHAWILP